MSINERDINRSMYDYLPKYYEDIREVRAITDAESVAIKRLNADAADVLAQLHVDVATWGLVNWERLIGVKNSESYKMSTFKSVEKAPATYAQIEAVTWDAFEVMFPKDIEERRSDIKAKMRGQGTVTKKHIVDVVSSYANGTVDAIDDPINYRVIVRFIDEDAIPSNLEQVKSVIREITPAHLTLEYTLVYLLINDIEQTMTLSALETKTLSEFAGGGTFGE